MGISFGTKNKSVDMTYKGFLRFRERVAFIVNVPFGIHYETLKTVPIFHGREEFFEQFDKKTQEIIEKEKLDEEILNFFFEPDCEGSISNEMAKYIYEKIKDYETKENYGYGIYPLEFNELLSVFKDAKDNGLIIKWD